MCVGIREMKQRSNLCAPTLPPRLFETEEIFSRESQKETTSDTQKLGAPTGNSYQPTPQRR